MEQKIPPQIVDETTHQWFDRKRFADTPALLIGTYRAHTKKALTKEHLDELAQLAETHGIPVIDSFAICARTFVAATFLSEGKLEEIKEAIATFQAKLVIFDDEITPAQQRNLEKYLAVPVIDRTEVILGVFADRAKTHEAKLQIDYAKVRYLAPRLKRMWTHLSKQTGGGGGAGGGGYLKGEGEKQIEIDRRLLKKKEEDLIRQIKEVAAHRKVQRAQRKRNDIPVFAICGYTNAGKSTLMHALTAADVLIEDKLFATLDTTTRKFFLPKQKKPILLTDTVGFIRKLPHLLVMAFKSTLEEAVYADVVIHVIDASHPMAVDHAETTLKVLHELELGSQPIITVFNKMDLVTREDALLETKAAYQKLRLTYPRAIEMAATTKEGISLLVERMEEVVQKECEQVRLRIPQSEYHMVSLCMRLGKVMETEYEENDVILLVDMPLEHVKTFKRYAI